MVLALKSRNLPAQLRIVIEARSVSGKTLQGGLELPLNEAVNVKSRLLGDPNMLELSES